MAFAIASTVDLVHLAEQPNQALLDLAAPTTTALETMLHDAKISRVYTDYWLAYPLTFRHTNGLVASPLDLPRVITAQRAVDDARATTWIVYVASRRDRALGPELRRRGIIATRRVTGPFALYQLDRYLTPLDLNRFWVTYPPGR